MIGRPAPAGHHFSTQAVGQAGTLQHPTDAICPGGRSAAFALSLVPSHLSLLTSPFSLAPHARYPMSPNPLLLGLCPIGKFVFSNEDAVRQKRAIQEKLRLWQIPFIDLEGVLEDGLVKDQAHCDAAVARFRQAGVNALFMPHCNFGTEGAVGMIARKLGVPVLLWGPRDDAPLADGTRLRDTLCGLFASSKVLTTLGVPFTYIENCRVDDPQLRQGVAPAWPRLADACAAGGLV